MFVRVRFGDDESLLCNPQCIVNNLLDSIKKRSGLANSGKVLDLSDETGLVLRLDDHKEDYSDLYLSDYSTYVLVEKQTSTEPANENAFIYVPLLENCSTHLPKFNIRVPADTPFANLLVRDKTPRARKSAGKSPNRKTKRGKATTTKSQKGHE